MRALLRCLLAGIFFFSLVSSSAKGQGKSALKGTVEDVTGAAIVDAEVKLRNAATNEELSTTSDEDGDFAFKDLPSGSYLITVTAGGFEHAEMPVEVGAAAAQPIHIRLKIAQTRQEIHVVAQVSAQENTDFLELDQHWLQNLPLLEGDPLAIPSLFLDPAALGSGSGGPQLIVDGVESDSLELPTASIKAVYVNRSPYSAEFGRPGTGRIEVITRQGSHHIYRGTVSLLVRNSAVDARNAFATTRPPLQHEIFEGEVSGPVRRHLTFLLAGRGVINNNTSVVSALLPPSVPGAPPTLLTENFRAPGRNAYVFGRLDFDLRHRNKLGLLYKYKDKAQRNQNVGGFNLPERATDVIDRENEFKIFETATLSENFLNEARFTFKVQPLVTSSLVNQQAILVLGAFNSGGAQMNQRRRDTVTNIQDIGTLTKSNHSLHFGGGIRPRFVDVFDASNFGGTFTFASLAAYSAAPPPPPVPPPVPPPSPCSPPTRTPPCPELFTMNEGNPRVSFNQVQYYSFLEDEIRLRPNFSMVLGLRHEFESDVHRYDSVAPRLAVAIAPGNQRTVIRGGAGVFYERRPAVLQQQALLFGGSNVQQIVISNPSFPNPFSSATITPPSVARIAPDIRFPYLAQASIGIERKLGKGRNYFALAYTTLRGLHLYRTRDINAPLPGTPGSTLFPDPNFTRIDQFESSGSSRSNSLTTTLQLSVRSNVDFVAHYRFSKSFDNTSGLLSRPADNYDLLDEWGRSDFDQRHRINLIGTYRLPFKFRAGSVVNWYSGIPFNITTGHDNNNDTIFNDRPFGVGRNTGLGPGYANVDLHLSRDFRLRRNEHRPKMQLGMDAFNVFNHVNFKNFVGTQTSGFFGRANAAKPARQLQGDLKFDF